jgi:hypothetical protein
LSNELAASLIARPDHQPVAAPARPPMIVPIGPPNEPSAAPVAAPERPPTVSPTTSPVVVGSLCEPRALSAACSVLLPRELLLLKRSAIGVLLCVG